MIIRLTSRRSHIVLSGGVLRWRIASRRNAWSFIWIVNINRAAIALIYIRHCSTLPYPQNSEPSRRPLCSRPSRTCATQQGSVPYPPAAEPDAKPRPRNEQYHQQMLLGTEGEDDPCSTTAPLKGAVQSA